ncbi:MAG TPA: dihydropteroate synthase [Verrucomicrobiae bacterium]|nr:dihydropteroate synthase [Verrucomicrobiae bacterium]
MGVVNVTPDSFSDGGKYFDAGIAVEHGLRLLSEGADILDIGGESTRPKAEPISEEEELRRVIPVVRRLAGNGEKPISIDTQKPKVAEEAIHAGASIINDIAGHRDDPAMWNLVAKSGCGYVLMHMKGTPATMLGEARYENVVDEISRFFAERLRMIQSRGINSEQVILDPGIGFAKNAEHNLELLARLKHFTLHERPLLIGASRKSFIGKLLGSGVEDRLPGSLGCAVWAVLNGVQIIRTHDVAATVQAVRMVEEIRARQE